MDASQHQGMNNTSMESMLVCSKSQQDPRKPRPQPEQALPCPRCESTNTKFCYYNNYSLTQPRYFCKSCRRYWTKGGTLRNVPVGGGCRKNKRSSSLKRTPDPNNLNSTSSHLTGTPPALNYDAGDHLCLAFARLQKFGGQLDLENETEIFGFIGNPPDCDINSTIGGGAPGFLDTMRSGSGFLGNNNHISNFQNFCYGNVDGEMLVPTYEDSSLNLAPMKQEFASSGVKFDGGNEQSKGMWSFPYHGDNAKNLVDFENAGRESWNVMNGFNSSWHGLLNSPLM